MSSDGGPSAKRPKFDDQDDDKLLPGIQERRASIGSTGGNRGGESFPQQLMKILNDPANSEIVAWVPSGDAFMVHSKDQFVTEVMPAYFGKQSKFTSFTRKLNRWGFTRRDGQVQNKGAYSHPLFHRDDPTSHEKMSCISQSGQGGGKAKRRNSGPMAMSKANAQVSAGEVMAVAGSAGAGADLAGAMGVGLITPQIAHEQLTSQMMFGSQGLPNSADGFTGLSPFGFTPMAMTPGTLSIVSDARDMRDYYFHINQITHNLLSPIPLSQLKAGLTPGGVTGLTPGTLTPGILSGLSPMMQINAAATAEQQGLGAGFGNGTVGGALPPPPPLAGPTATPSDSAPNISGNTKHDVMGFTDSNGESQSQKQHAAEGQPPQQQQMRNHASSQNPFLNNNMGMPFSGGLMGSFASAQHFLQMQQQRVQQQLQAQQMQLLQLKRQQAALANSSNTGSLEGPGTGEGVGVGSGAVTTGGGNDELGDLNSGGLGGTGFSPAPPGDDNVPPVRPASGNDLMQMQLIQQMQAHHQQQILNGTSLQLHAGANGLAGVGGGVLQVGADPDPLPTGVNPQVPMGSMTTNGTISGPGQFQLQQQEAGGVGVGGNQGEAPVPATPSDPAEEQPDIPNITDSDTTKEAMTQPKVAAVGTTPTPVADAQ